MNLKFLAKTKTNFLDSHLNALKAQEEGRLEEEIIPVQIPNDYQQTIVKDNGPRDGQTIEALKKLKPYFDRKLGSVTAGSSSQITDGAGSILLMRESTAKARGLTLGFLKDYAYAGCDPKTMGMGPTFASHRLFRKNNITMNDIDLVEINAFAAQVLGNVHAFESESFYKKELSDDRALGKLWKN